MSSIPVANFASCLGKYDTTIQGSVVSDSADYAGTGDISFNGGYVLNTTAFVLPAPVTGNGISFSGWFYPTGVEPANTALFGVSCAPAATTSHIAVYFTGTNALSMTYNGTSESTSSNVYSINAWNFFMYTVCCSGNLAIQNLYVNTIGTSANPATLTNSAGTYTQYTVNSTLLGFGVGSTFGVTKYVGKMDDFRFYSRVITPMEYRVLQGSNYGNGFASLTPSLGNISYALVSTAGISSVLFTLSNAGTYSFLRYQRFYSDGTIYNGILSASQLTPNGSNYTWTDTTVVTGTGSYSYQFTPWVGGSSGASSGALTVNIVGAFSVNSNITNWQLTDMSGTSVTNGIKYSVFVFKKTGITYQLTYAGGNSYMYVLAVGGGGSGANDGGSGYGGGGGGAGGVVMMPVYLTTPGTITVVVGAGGSGLQTNSYKGVLVGNNGSNTTVSFSANPSANIVAWGGGGGGGGGMGSGAGFYGLSGGSSGGATNLSTICFVTPVPPITTSFNYGNWGGGFHGSTGGGGGGAGTNGFVGNNTNNGGFGGNGIQCFLPGISTFTPPGYASFGTYYWGGGGGGTSNTNTAFAFTGNGGLGGGGGGSSVQPSQSGIGGAGGISPGIGGGGNNSTGGNAGANTGGGGGGCWTSNNNNTYINNIPGNGGSGIVVLAFPQNNIINNMNAVLPVALANSGQYNAVLNNPSLSTNAYNSIRGAFACRLLNYNYFGPIMNLRANSDSSGYFVQPFYADVCGNLGTGYLGTGMSVRAWLAANNANTTYAHVTKWYDQGMDYSFNCAFSNIPSLQPIYDVSNGLINFGYTGSAGNSTAAPQTNCYFTLFNGSYPTGDSSFSYVTRLNNLTSGTDMVMGVGGLTGANNIAMYMNVLNNGTVNNYVGQATYSTTSYTANTAYMLTYDNKSGTASRIISLYSNANGTESLVTSGNPGAVLTIGPSYNYLGAGNVTGVPSTTSQVLNGQMYSFFAFNTALGTTDRLLIENTSYALSTPTTITGLAMSSVTSTNFVLSWTAVSGATYYLLYVNGVYNGNVTSGSVITPSVTYPWTCNLSAYTTNNVLVATGSVTPSPLAFYVNPANISNWTTLESAGTSVTNGITYQVLMFTRFQTYIVPYTLLAPGGSYIYVLAVGGGGSGGSSTGGGGGGGGGVVMMPVFLSSSGTITIYPGQVGGSVTGTFGQNGGNTTVSFSANPSANIIAYGGGGGGFNSTGGTTGGSSGGAGYNMGIYNPVNPAPPVTNSFNYGNWGGGNNYLPGSCAGGGGGGAGTNGTWGQNSPTIAGGNGGNGIQCFLPGIRDYSPPALNTPLGNFYWGAGGGGGSYNNVIQYQSHGGLGGGGGGNNNSTGSPGLGGLGFFNPGTTNTPTMNGNSNNSTVGAGMQSTGAGGGGSYGSTASGMGGYGVVVIAFPQTAITSNMNAVLPATLVASGQYNAVLNNPSLSTNAYNSIRGAFACRLLNYNYFGPIMNLRHSADPSGYYVKPFYADVCGNLGTGYLGTGQSVFDWLSSNGANTTYAYVTKWYDQGMDVSFSCAFSNVPSLQPIYDVVNSLINFGNTSSAGGYAAAPQTGCYFTLPSGAYPYGDSSFSYVTRLNNLTSGTDMVMGVGGVTGANNNAMYMNVLSNGSVNNYVAQSTYSTTSYTANTAYALTYDNKSGVAARVISLYSNTNGVETSVTSGSPGTTLTLSPTYNYLGAGNVSGVPGTNQVLNGQMYSFFVFNTALGNTDRLVIENTPYIYVAPTTIAGLTVTNITNTNFTLTWNEVTGVAYYQLYVNGSFYTYGSVVNGMTVNPASRGPWNCKLYAYNSTNSLIATASSINIGPFVIYTSGNEIYSTSITNDITYQVFTLKNTNQLMTLYYTVGGSYMYVLAVGGGGSGGGGSGGGGGGGGVVMTPVWLSGGFGTVTVYIGNNVGVTSNGFGTTGIATDVSFSANPSANIHAWGGGGGGYSSNVGYTGGSSGGAGYNIGVASQVNTTPPLTGIITPNYGNWGGGNNSTSTTAGGGGGGAGSNGIWGVQQGAIGGWGGNGIQCTLPGIKDFAPSGTLYGTYYWGGGGGGSSVNTLFFNSNGNGGWGGGGGGGNSLNGSGGLGGTGGLNSGGTGASNNGTGGNGASNTGSGGGGGTNGQNSGYGGSGIVILAFPISAAITNNIDAAVSPAMVASGQYNAVLNNPSLSTNAYNSIRGAYGCKLLNYNYFGPVMNLRFNTDTNGYYVQPFYADVCGNLGTGYLGTGTSVRTWLAANNANATYAYVTKWYDQGMDPSFNCAYQYTFGNQPIYDVCNGVINFGYTGGAGGSIAAPQTGCYFMLPTGALPYNDSSFSYITRLNNLTSGTDMIMGAGGATGANNNAMYMSVLTNSNVSSLVGQVTNSTNIYTANNAYTLTYDNKSGASTRVATIYYNNNGIETQTSSGNPSAALTVLPTYQYIGAGNVSGVPSTNQVLNGQMYSFFAFNTALGSTDRLLIENTPYVLTTSTTVISTSPLFISVSNWQPTDMSGISVTNGITYNICVFKTAGLYQVMTYTLPVATYPVGTYIYVLAVGGGGGAASGDGAGGGGGGGVVMLPIYLTSSGTISVSVGLGGLGSNGNPSIVNFSANPSMNITAMGGGMGGVAIGNIGGSGGGGGHGSGFSTAQHFANGNGYNFTNVGAFGGTVTASGGGGAGSYGLAMYNALRSGNGGNGIQCFLPGIRDFTPPEYAPFSTYYWAGGGGGSSTLNTNDGNNGNGGLGGGGGGSNTVGNANSYTAGNGGLGGISAGGSGSVLGTAGNGGANTGGGAGASWSNVSGVGGSGIVVIAIPQTAITRNMDAVLPPTLVASGQYNDVLNNPSLSANAVSSIRGAYSCRLLNYNYFGPVMNLRNTMDDSGNFVQPFYADVCGNLGTGYLGTGMSLSAWLTAWGANTSYAFVTKWYDQGMDPSFNCAYQTTALYQPIYDVAKGVINFGYQGTAGGSVSAPGLANFYFNLPNGAYPTGDSSFSYITRLYNLTSATDVIMGVGGNSAGTNNAMYMSIVNNSSVNGIVGQTTNTINSYVPNTAYTLTYDNKAGASTRVATIYYNTSGTETQVSYTNPASALTLLPTYQFIGYGNAALNTGATAYAGNTLNGQMYSFFANNNALVPADRTILETVPYLPPTTAAIAGLTVSNITSTNFTLTWTAVSGASYYLLYINGSYYGTVTSGSTITPPSTIAGPWRCNLNAYNSNYTLLAMGYTTTGLFTTVLNKAYTAVVALTGISNSGGTATGVSVSLAQDRMLIMTNGGIYYSTSTNSGASWSAPTQISGVGTGSNGSVYLSQDGTKGLGFGWANAQYSIYWPAGTGQTPSVTTLTYSMGYQWSQVSGKADGSVAVIHNYGSGLFYLTWNYVTNAYNLPIQFTYNGTAIVPTHVGGAISLDGLTVITDQCPGNTAYYGYITLTWSTTTPPVPTLKSNWIPTGPGLGGNNYVIGGTSANYWGMIFIGGTATTPPTNILGANASALLTISAWDNTSKAAIPSFSLLGNSLGCNPTSMSAVGPQGNILYFTYNPTGTTSNTISVGKITLSVI